jgi:heme-degrading monooxygenase HmoA
LEKAMIARIWRGQAATKSKADAYYDHFRVNVAPHLTGIAGHRGAYLLRRECDGNTEFLAITLWDSIESVKKFAGNRPDVAVVEPEAVAILSEFDDFVQHFEIAYSSI